MPKDLRRKHASATLQPIKDRVMLNVMLSILSIGSIVSACQENASAMLPTMAKDRHGDN